MWGLAVIVGLYFYIRLAMWVAKWMSGKYQTKKGKWLSRFLVSLVFILIPTGDAIVGRIYLDHLCSTEAGVRVYQTLELPAEYWDEQGRPRFIAPNGFVDMKLLPNYFEWRNVDESYVDSVIKIEKGRWQLMIKETQSILGEKITYMRHFGWLNHFSPAPNIGESCRDLGGEFNREDLLRKEREQDQMFFLGIFKPATSTR